MASAGWSAFTPSSRTLEIGVIGIGGIMGLAVMFIIATTVCLAFWYCLC